MNTAARFIFLLLISAIISHGCSSATKVNPQESLEKRVHALMTAKVEGDWKLVYTFFDENYKSKTPKTKYDGPRSVQFSNYKIENITMTDSEMTKASVTVKYDLMAAAFSLEDNEDIQIWVFENNDWFFAAKPDSDF